MTDEEIKKVITEQTSVFIRCLNESFLQVLDKITEQDELLVQISRAVDNLEAHFLIDCEKELKKIRDGYETRPSLDEGIVDFEEDKARVSHKAFQSSQDKWEQMYHQELPDSAYLFMGKDNKDDNS